MRPQAAAATGSRSTDPGSEREGGHGEAAVEYPHSTTTGYTKQPSGKLGAITRENGRSVVNNLLTGETLSRLLSVESVLSWDELITDPSVHPQGHRDKHALSLPTQDTSTNHKPACAP